MMKRAFELGYRRYEWKCNCAERPVARRGACGSGSRTRASSARRASTRDATATPRGTPMIDHEWPALDRAFRRWLDPSNFDEHGRQRVALSTLTAPILVSRG